MGERYEFQAAMMVKASFAIENDVLVYRQGIRTYGIPTRRRAVRCSISCA